MEGTFREQFGSMEEELMFGFAVSLKKDQSNAPSLAEFMF